MKNMNLQIQKSKSSKKLPSRINSKRPTLSHTRIKLSKNKDRILKVARDKQLITYKRSSIKLTANFSSEINEARDKGKTYLNC